MRNMRHSSVCPSVETWKSVEICWKFPQCIVVYGNLRKISALYNDLWNMWKTSIVLWKISAEIHMANAEKSFNAFFPWNSAEYFANPQNSAENLWNLNYFVENLQPGGLCRYLHRWVRHYYILNCDNEWLLIQWITCTCNTILL